MKEGGRPQKNSPLHIEIAQLAQNALSTKFYQEAEARIPRKTIGNTYCSNMSRDPSSNRAKTLLTNLHNSPSKYFLTDYSWTSVELSRGG